MSTQLVLTLTLDDVPVDDAVISLKNLSNDTIVYSAIYDNVNKYYVVEDISLESVKYEISVLYNMKHLKKVYYFKEDTVNYLNIQLKKTRFILSLSKDNAILDNAEITLKNSENNTETYSMEYINESSYYMVENIIIENNNDNTYDININYVENNQNQSLIMTYSFNYEDVNYFTCSLKKTRLIITITKHMDSIKNANITLKKTSDGDIIYDGNPYDALNDYYLLEDIFINTSDENEYEVTATYEDNGEIKNIVQTYNFKFDEINYFPINIDECGNRLVTNKDCKYFLHEPYMTPNNYDLYFNYNEIPSNIIIESPNELRKRLQRTLPLTKILHLNMETEQNPQKNTINIGTSLRLKFNEENNNQTNIKKIF